MSLGGKKETILSGIWTKIVTWLSPKKNQTPISSDTLFDNNDLYNAFTDYPYDYYGTIGSIRSVYTTNTNNSTTYTGGYGGGGGTSSMAGSQGIYTISGLTTTTSSTGISISTGNTGGWSLGNSLYGQTADSDITLRRNGKSDLKIGATLDLILESLYIIVPDQRELENNPALKAAYEHWQEKFDEYKKHMNPVKEAYDSYMLMQKLVEDTEE